jgi:hypothetical protein
MSTTGPMALEHIRASAQRRSVKLRKQIRRGQSGALGDRLLRVVVGDEAYPATGAEGEVFYRRMLHWLARDLRHFPFLVNGGELNADCNDLSKRNQALRSPDVAGCVGGPK